MYCVRTNGSFFGTIPSFHTSSAMMIYDDVVWCIRMRRENMCVWHAIICGTESILYVVQRESRDQKKDTEIVDHAIVIDNDIWKRKYEHEKGET